MVGFTTKKSIITIEPSEKKKKLAPLISMPSWNLQTKYLNPRHRVYQHEQIDPQQLAADGNEGGHWSPHDFHHQQQCDAKGQPFLCPEA